MKSFRFEAAHRLATWPETHQCHRLHGHTYEVRIYLRAPQLNHACVVVDFGELNPLREALLQKFDHEFLNDQVPFEPTAEMLAAYIFERVQIAWPDYVHAVRVYETRTSYAEFKLDDDPDDPTD